MQPLLSPLLRLNTAPTPSPRTCTPPPRSRPHASVRRPHAAPTSLPRSCTPPPRNFNAAPTPPWRPVAHHATVRCCTLLRRPSATLPKRRPYAAVRQPDAPRRRPAPLCAGQTPPHRRLHAAVCQPDVDPTPTRCRPHGAPTQLYAAPTPSPRPPQTNFNLICLLARGRGGLDSDVICHSIYITWLKGI